MAAIQRTLRDDNSPQALLLQAVARNVPPLSTSVSRYIRLSNLLGRLALPQSEAMTVQSVDGLK
jgi:hypothetical protein